jgi:hypothetical protein
MDWAWPRSYFGRDFGKSLLGSIDQCLTRVFGVVRVTRAWSSLTLEAQPTTRSRFGV